MKNKTLPVFLAFLCMGFGDAAGPLTSQLQNSYELSNFTASFVTFVGFIMFGLLSIPMGLYQDRKGKKHVLQLGLIVALIGLVVPIISNYSSFALILVALLLLGAGAAILQVAGNPIMRDVSPEGKYSRNLSFGQFVKGIGTLSTVFIPILAIKFLDYDWRLLFPIYSILLLIVILILLPTKIKEKDDEKGEAATFKSCISLLNNRFILLMVLGIFFYVGAEVCMSSKLPNYLEYKFNFDIEELGLFGTLFFFIAVMTGRFLGGVILNWMSPKKFLVITAFVSLLALAGLFIAPNQIIAFVTIFMIGLGFANIFPLVFSITVDTMPERGNEISGLMVTAILGGAFVPLAFGAVADMVTLMAGFIVPIVCIFYILMISFKTTSN